MKRTIILGIALFSLILSACSRDEPVTNNPVTPPVQVGSVVINEVFSTGSPDWVELYNPGTASIDISGYKMYDPDGNTGAKDKFVVPAGTVIPAGGYLTLDCDGSGANLNPNFKFSASGEEVWIENTTGTIVDHVVFPALGTDTSYARVPDGTANFQKMYPATKGAANIAGGTPTILPIVINEIMSTGTPDWVELYNPNDQAIDISGYFVYDPSTVTTKFVIPAGTSIPAKGFIVLPCDDTNTGLHTNFKLSSGGEDVTVENAAGVLVDKVTFPALTAGSSYCRIPDGSTNWQISTTPTEGSTNQ